MSGCCGQGPVINAAAAPSRVDVETVLLCDVLADGTVAAVVLVEPIYDTNTGQRVSTRIVNPTTGATYTPTGTLGLCSPPADECARQITQVTRCDDTTGDGVGDTEYVEVWALDPCDGGTPQLVGTYAAGDYSSAYTPTSPAPCPTQTPDTPVVLGTVCYDDGAGGTGTAAVLKCAGCSDPAVTYLDLATGTVLAAPAIVPCPAASERSSQLLCDVQADGTSAPFLRTFITDDTGTTTADTLLDGTTAYTPTGTVGVCLPVNDCASPTTPTATIGLCLPDGTPIAVTVVRDCDGVVTSEGWINLQTGAYSAGAPPVGTVACGSSQSVQVSGTFCDVDAAGDVVGLVLIEYSYAADGTIDSVRLVDATTGATYTPTGTVTTCPAGVEQPEQDVVQLCDTAANGTVTAMVRDYRRDETGAIVGHSDYLLDGTPYTPTGTVGDCQPDPQPERDLAVLCDVQANGSVTTFLRDYQRDAAGTVTGHADYALDGSTPYAPTGTVGVCVPPCTEQTAQLLCDSTVTFDPTTVTLRAADPDDTSANTQYPGHIWQDAAPAAVQTVLGGGAASWGNTAGLNNTSDHFVWGAFGFTLPDCVPCGSYEDMGDVTLNMRVTVRNDGPNPGVAADGVFALFNGSTWIGQQAVNANLPVGGTQTLTFTPTVHAIADLPNVIAVLALEIKQGANTEKTWTVSALTYSLTPVAGSGSGTAGCGQQFVRTFLRDCTTGELVATVDAGLDGQPYTPTGAVAVCQPDAPCGAGEMSCQDGMTLSLCDVAANGTTTPFLRHLAYDCTGTVTGTTDTALDGTTPYTPAGTVGVCDPAAPAAVDVETIPLCVVDNATGNVIQYVREEVVYDDTGARTATRYVDAATGAPVTLPGGTHLDVCPAPDTCTKQVIERCSCDDTDGDGIGDVQYTELWAVDPCGGDSPALLGTYLDGDLTQPYTPVSPVDCTAAELLPGPLSTGVRAVTGTAAQNLAGSFPALQSVSLTVLAGAVNVTMTDGSAVPIPAGVTMTWSVAQDSDTALAVASFAGATAAASYLLNWTYR